MEVQSGLTNSIIFLHGIKHQLFATNFGLLILNLQKSGERMYEANSHRQSPPKKKLLPRKTCCIIFREIFPIPSRYLCDLIWINVQIAIEVIIKLTPWFFKHFRRKMVGGKNVILNEWGFECSMATRNDTCLQSWTWEYLKMVNSSESWMVHRVFHTLILDILAALWNMIKLGSLRAIGDHQTWRASLLMTRK